MGGENLDARNLGKKSRTGTQDWRGSSSTVQRIVERGDWLASTYFSGSLRFEDGKKSKFTVQASIGIVTHFFDSNPHLFGLLWTTLNSNSNFRHHHDFARAIKGHVLHWVSFYKLFLCALIDTSRPLDSRNEPILAELFTNSKLPLLRLRSTLLLDYLVDEYGQNLEFIRLDHFLRFCQIASTILVSDHFTSSKKDEVECLQLAFLIKNLAEILSSQSLVLEHRLLSQKSYQLVFQDLQYLGNFYSKEISENSLNIDRLIFHLQESFIEIYVDYYSKTLGRLDEMLKEFIEEKKGLERYDLEAQDEAHDQRIQISEEISGIQAEFSQSISFLISTYNFKSSRDIRRDLHSRSTIQELGNQIESNTTGSYEGSFLNALNKLKLITKSCQELTNSISKDQKSLYSIKGCSHSFDKHYGAAFQEYLISAESKLGFFLSRLRSIPKILERKVSMIRKIQAEEDASSGLESFSKVINDERKDIVCRRKKFGLIANESADIEKNIFGVCFSGGGIRSASFHLGFLEALSESGLLKHVDYISTVSGGGYVASAFLTHVKKHWEYHRDSSRNASEFDPDEFLRGVVDSTRNQMLRNPSFLANFDPVDPKDTSNGKFPILNPKKTFQSFYRVLDAVVSTIFLFLALPLTFLYGVITVVIFGIYFGIGTAALFRGCLIESYEESSLLLCINGPLGIYLIVKMGILLFLALYFLFTRPFKGTVVHPKYTGLSISNCMRYVLITTSIQLTMFLLTLTTRILADYPMMDNVVSGIILGLLFIILSAFAFRMLTILIMIYVIIILSIFSVWAAFSYHFVFGINAEGYESFFENIKWLILFLPVLTFFLKYIKGITQIYYSWRIRKSFYASSADLLLSEFSPGPPENPPYPYYICSASRNNIFSSDTSRTYGLFSLTPNFIGASEIRYVPTHSGVSLSKAVGLSAAVFSQSMGKYTLAQISLLGGFFSSGLGDWVIFENKPKSINLPFLGYVHYTSLVDLLLFIPAIMIFSIIILYERDAYNNDELARVIIIAAQFFVFLFGLFSFFGNVSKWFRPLLGSPAIQTLHQSLGAAYALDSETVREKDILGDILPSYKKLKRYFSLDTQKLHPPLVFVSDGGHFENLGLLELLRRRCAVILCGDDGMDPKGLCKSLYYVLSLAREERVDFVVPEGLNVSQIPLHRRIEEFSQSSEPFLHLKVIYPDDFESLSSKAPVEITTADLFYVKAKRNPDDREYGSWKLFQKGFWCQCCHEMSYADPKRLYGPSKDPRVSPSTFPFHSTAVQCFTRSLLQNYALLGANYSSTACQEILFQCSDRLRSDS